MSRVATLQQLFKRYKRPADLVFAVIFLLLSLALLSQIGEQTVWKSRTQLFSQPAFWPGVSLIAMTVFAFLHWVSSVLSPKINGRWEEVGFWLRSIEFVIWFMVYVALVPVLGYLPSSIIFATTLAYRMGYRGTRSIFLAIVTAFFIVLIFKSFLQVRVPGGMIYEILPSQLRSFMLTYF
jgi:hypothetical protein